MSSGYERYINKVIIIIIIILLLLLLLLTAVTIATVTHKQTLRV